MYFYKWCKEIYNNFKGWLKELKYDYLSCKINYKEFKNIQLHPLIEIPKVRFNRLKTPCRNLIYWLPYIWYDRDWDYFFIYVILKAKLAKVKRFMQLHSVTVVDKEIKEIDECIRILDVLIEDNVLEEEFGEFYKKYGHIKLTFRKMENGLSIAEGGYEKVQTENEYREAEKEFKRLITKEEEEKNRLRKRLFNIMADNIEGWWD